MIRIWPYYPLISRVSHAISMRYLTNLAYNPSHAFGNEIEVYHPHFVYNLRVMGWVFAAQKRVVVEVLGEVAFREMGRACGEGEVRAH